MKKTLMTLKGSKMLTNTWKQELQILEDEVYGEILILGKRKKMHLPYKNIAQVDITRGILTADIEIVNKGGSNNLIIKAVNKKEAGKAKELIDKKILDIVNTEKLEQTDSSADEIKKLFDLMEKNIITEEEFEKQKKSILGL